MTALGFAPVGHTIERCRFFTPLHWRWASRPSRWFASPDRRVSVALHRLAGGHPLRISAYTTFEGGGLLMTSTAQTGLGGEIGARHRRVEIADADPGEILRQHERNVSDFGRDAGLRPRSAALADVAAESLIITQPYVVRHRFAQLYAFALIFVAPVWALLAATGRGRETSLVVPVGLCLAALLFALLRLAALPEYRRVRWVAFVALALLGFSIPLLTHRSPRHRRSPPRVGQTPAGAVR